MEDKLNQFMMAVFLGCAVLNLFVRNAYDFDGFKFMGMFIDFAGLYSDVFQKYFKTLCRKSEILHWKTVASFLGTEKISDTAEKGISYL